MKTPLVDCHVHLSFFNPAQLEDIFKKSGTHDIQSWILGGYDSPDWQKQKQIVQSGAKVKTCFGLHPWRVLEMNEAQIAAEMNILGQELPLADACGETGIDGFKTHDEKELRKQEECFETHLETNKKAGKPVVLHIVKSYERSLSHLRKHSFRGFAHAFSGSYEVASQLVDLGYKISVGRGVYHQGFKQLKDTVQKMDLKHLVVESDAHVNDKGVVEDPVEILLRVMEAVAEIKSVPVEKVARFNYENAQEIFGPL